MGGSSVMEWCEEVPLCLLLSVTRWVFQYLDFTFASSSLAIIKSCVNNHSMEKKGWERQKTREVRRERWREVTKKAAFVRPLFLGERKSEREREVAEEDIWRAGVTASCGRKTKWCKSIGKCSLYRSLRNITGQCWKQGYVKTCPGKDSSMQWLITPHRVRSFRCPTDLN